MEVSKLNVVVSSPCTNHQLGTPAPCFSKLTSDGHSRTRVDKVNAELVTLTYGTIVAQLCQDYDSNYQEVNKQLDKMGYNIGMRLIEDFLAKSGVGRCANFRETADMIAKVRLPRTHEVLPLAINRHHIETGRIQNLSQRHTHCDQLDQ